MPTVIVRSRVHPVPHQEQPPPVMAEVHLLVQPRHTIGSGRSSTESATSAAGQVYLMQRGRIGTASVVPYAQPVFVREGDVDDDEYIEAQVS